MRSSSLQRKERKERKRKEIDNWSLVVRHHEDLRNNVKKRRRANSVKRLVRHIRINERKEKRNEQPSF